MSGFRIGIDGAVLSKPLSGIGRYLFEICERLDELQPETLFYVYSPRPLCVKLPSDRWKARIGGHGVARFLSSYAWLKLSAGRMALIDKIDVFWAPRSILPGRCPALATVATVHDLNCLVFPASMPIGTLWAHRLWFDRDIRRADIVVANSDGTKARLKALLNVDADAVAKPGIAAVFFPRPSAQVTERLKSLQVDKPYFLAVGAMEPRKNLVSLIEAFVSLKRSEQLDRHDLIIAGGGGWRGGETRSTLADADQWGVRWLGFVDDEDLAMLYTGTVALVFPSLYEGFGIPAVEARACGARVVASDIPELREAAGPQGIYVQPTVDGIRTGLLTAMSADTSKPEIAHDWMESARVMATVFQRIHATRHAKFG